MILIEKYNENWSNWFSDLYSEIWPSVKDYALSLEHVGSTSVPGLAAKPIIDMDIIIDNNTCLPEIIKSLANLGYKHRGNLGIEGREAFLSPDHKIKHHLYVCLKDCIALKNHLALRDYLRTNKQARDEYSNLKYQLAKDFPDSIENYIEGKTQFILNIISTSGLSQKELNSIEMANKSQKK